MRQVVKANEVSERSVKTIQDYFTKGMCERWQQRLIYVRDVRCDAALQASCNQW